MFPSLRKKLEENYAQSSQPNKNMVASTVKQTKQTPPPAQTVRTNVSPSFSMNREQQTSNYGRALQKQYREGRISNRQFSQMYGDVLKGSVPVPSTSENVYSAIGGTSKALATGASDFLTKGVVERTRRALPGGNADLEAQQRLVESQGNVLRVTNDAFRKGRINSDKLMYAYDDFNRGNSELANLGNSLNRAGSVKTAAGDVLSAVTLLNPAKALKAGVVGTDLANVSLKSLPGQSVLFNAPKSVERVIGAVKNPLERTLFSEGTIQASRGIGQAGLRDVAVTGAKQGAIGGVANELQNNQHITPTSLLTSVGMGTAMGIGVGGGIYGGTKVTTKLVQQGVRAIDAPPLNEVGAIGKNVNKTNLSQADLDKMRYGLPDQPKAVVAPKVNSMPNELSGKLTRSSRVDGTPTEQTLFKPVNKEPTSGTKSKVYAQMPDYAGWEKVYKPYGEQGKGFYYTRTAQSKPSIPPSSTGLGEKPPTQSLINEAKKYKSAEEFVNSHQPVYHGTSADITDMGQLQSGRQRGDYSPGSRSIFASENPELAKRFGDNMLEGRNTGKTLDTTKLGDLHDPNILVVPKEFADYKTSPILDARDKRVLEQSYFKSGTPSNITIDHLPNIQEYFKSKGYSAIQIPRSSDVPGKATEMVIIDPSKIKTPQQLIDIYNQAHANSPTLPRSVAPKTPLTPDSVPTKAVGQGSEQLANRPTLQDALDGKSTKIRSEVTSGGRKTTPLETPTQRIPVEKVNNQGKTLSNNTPEKIKVKLNTNRLNMDGGYDAMAKLDESTASTVNKLSNKEVESIAKSAGLDTKTYSIGETKQRIAEQLNVRQDAVRLMNKAEVARKAGNTDQAADLLKQAAEQGRVSRTQGTDLARQLQARRIIANELDTPQQRVFKLFDEAGVNPDVYTKKLANVDFSDSKAVVSAYRELVPPKASQWLDTVRYNSMLSSPLTQAVNIFGNAQGVLGVAPIEKTLRGTMDAIGGVFGKERRYAAGEGFAYSKGSITNIRNATINFKDALTGGGKYANPDFNDYNMPLATKGVKGGVYKTLSFPMRVLDGMDKFFRTMASGGEEAALDLRAKKGIKLGGNKSALIEEESAYRVFQADSHKPGQGILLDASDSFADIIMSGRNNKNPVISTISKFTVPFVKTINNINKQGMVEYSPLGIINMKGNTDKVTALTRATMGTAVFGLSAMLVGAGDMTWAEPRDADERNRFRAEGKQPYSVKIGGKWVGFSKVHPSISFPMAMVSALDDAFNKGDIDQSFIDKVIGAVSKYGNFMSDQSYAKSVGDTLGAIGGNKEDIARMVSNNIQQVIPFRAFTGWVARMSDDVERKTDTTQNYLEQQVQLLMQQYPGLRQKVPTRDYRGKPIPANNQIFNAFSPVRVTDDRGVNPVDAQLDSIKEATETDPLLDKRQTKEVDSLVAKTLSTAQTDLIQNPSFQKLSDADKKSKLSKLSTDIRAVERRKYMAENNVGEYSREFTGKASKLTTDQKAILQGGSVDTARYASDVGEIPKDMSKDNVKTLERFAALDDTEKDDAVRKESDAEYKLTLAQYERDYKLGKISKVEDIKRTNELNKAKVGKDYAKEIREFYSLNRDDIYSYISTNKDGKAVSDKLLAYDDALVKAGIIEKNKFRDKNGNAKFNTAKKGGGKGKKKGDGSSKFDLTKLFALSQDPTSFDEKLGNLIRNAKISKGKRA